MRIATFIDYWNFQLTMNQKAGASRSGPDVRARIQWPTVGRTLAGAAFDMFETGSDLSYEGCYIYTSYDPFTDEGRKFHRWVTTWLGRQQGVRVEIRERKPKAPPTCSNCGTTISHCPTADCGRSMAGTIETAVDVHLATDLIRLAVGNFYDIAVLASLDADLCPAVAFVQSLGKKVIHAGFPPGGGELAAQCWGSFDTMKIAEQVAAPI